MIKGFAEIDFNDFSESIGASVMLMFTTFTGSIAGGLGAGIIIDCIVKLVSGKGRKIHPIMYVICALMVLYYIYG